MSLPVVSKDAALAVFDKAMTQSPDEYVGDGFLKMIKDDQTGLVSMIAANADGFGSLIEEVYPEAENIKGAVSMVACAAALMTYEAVKAQVESEDMQEMFSE
jgi:hypothetical protein